MQQLHGVFPAIVVNNVDPEQLGRVEVRLPMLPESELKIVTNWARIATLMAGNQRGTWFIPDIGDEVLVIFEGGDPRKPYVLGALWSRHDQPPETMDATNAIKSIHSRNGLKLTLDDHNGQESISLETPGGQAITLKDGPGAITITDTNGSTITLDAAGIRINAAVKVTVNAAVAEINTGMLTVNAGMSNFSGAVKCDTIIANSVVASSYTPGLGNIA